VAEGIAHEQEVAVLVYLETQHRRGSGATAKRRNEASREDRGDTRPPDKRTPRHKKIVHKQLQPQRPSLTQGKPRPLARPRMRFCGLFWLVHAMRKIVRLLLASVAAVVLLVVGCLAYIGFRAQRAARRVDRFCASVAAGDAVTGLTRRAREHGLEVREVPPYDLESIARPARLIAEDGVMLARHVCVIEHARERVVRVEKTFID
jgi:hypothetical protein